MSSRSERKNKMKNTIKSLFSLLFAFLILLPLIPLSAFAEGEKITSIVLNRDPYSVIMIKDEWMIAEPYYISLPRGVDTSTVRLYYADTDEPLKIYDKETFDDGYTRYYFDRVGTFMVYAMDTVTGQRSKAMEFRVVKYVTEIIALPETMPVLTSGEPFSHQRYAKIYNMTLHSIRLYYADTDLPVDRNEDSKYIINEPGEYRAYYMDEMTGVKSEEFTLTVKPAENPQTSDLIYIPILFAMLSAEAVYKVLKMRKYE